jgi:predicted aspartyl protease
MSSPHSQDFRPPFPTLIVHLRSGDVRTGPFVALLDTGADVTFVPLFLLEKIEALEAFTARVRSHFGDSKSAQLYVVAFEVDGVNLASTYVVADEDGNDIILGRDVLNKLPLFIDGLQLQTHLLSDAIVKRWRERLRQ